MIALSILAGFVPIWSMLELLSELPRPEIEKASSQIDVQFLVVSFSMTVFLQKLSRVRPLGLRKECKK
eukprot:5824174-Amphidinium_carterae.1